MWTAHRLRPEVGVIRILNKTCVVINITIKQFNVSCGVVRMLQASRLWLWGDLVRLRFVTAQRPPSHRQPSLSRQ